MISFSILPWFWKGILISLPNSQRQNIFFEEQYGCSALLKNHALLDNQDRAMLHIPSSRYGIGGSGDCYYLSIAPIRYDGDNQ